MPHGSHQIWLLRIIAKVAGTIRVSDWKHNRIDSDGLRYVATISVWAHWLTGALLLFELVYRPYSYFGVTHYFPFPLLLAVSCGLNGYIHYLLRSNRPISWHWLVAHFGLDLLLISVAAALSDGFDHPFIHLFYYLPLVGMAVLFSSFRLILVWVTMASIIYGAVALLGGDGIDIEASEEKVLLARLAVMYVVVAGVNLASSFERMRWRRAVEREGVFQRDVVEMSNAIHDSAAQTAYVIRMGVDAARTFAGDSNPELTTTLEATSRLCRYITFELRYPISVGGIYEGRELSRALESHASSFMAITSVPVHMNRTGVEPPLPMDARSLLFSIAHNALTNANRHAAANSVNIHLEFSEKEIRLSVSDDGVGLPGNYNTQGYGFQNMKRSAQLLGGLLDVEQRGAMGGATVTCTVPREPWEKRGR